MGVRQRRTQIFFPTKSNPNSDLKNRQRTGKNIGSNRILVKENFYVYLISMNMTNKIILVNKQDQEIGAEYKLEIHKQGKLHRAFSIFIFNSHGDLLLQKRALNKYHSGGLWSNSCCSHPEQNEEIYFSAHKRLKEEMGFDCELSELFSFIYKSKVGINLIENEFDHVFVGKFDGKLKINKKEVADTKWVNYDFLKKDIRDNPQNYAYWFKLCYKKVFKLLKDKNIEL